jgi:polyphosphate kinase
MHRNLDRRVELLVRVVDPGHEATLRDLFGVAMDEGTASWWLGPDGSWSRHHLDSSGAPLLDLQAHLIAIRRTGRTGTEADGRPDGQPSAGPPSRRRSRTPNGRMAPA